MINEDEWLVRQADGILRLLEDCGLDPTDIEWLTGPRLLPVIRTLQPTGARAEQAQQEFAALESDDLRRDVLRIAARLHLDRSFQV